MAFRAFMQKYVATPGVKRWLFNRKGYNKYGLLHDDLIYETPEVEEAIRRLPQEIKDERIYRIQRAMQLTLENRILPEEEWTKFEECQNNRYLSKFLEEVEREKKEREMWVKNN